MTETLHIFAVNLPLTMRHTHLTRLQNETDRLPPLEDWAGMALDLDRIELFPVKDLEGFSLASYVENAFMVEVNAQDTRRLDALQGHVLLVLDSIDQQPAPNAQLAHITALPVIDPDHRTLPMAEAGAAGAFIQDGVALDASPFTRPNWMLALVLGIGVLIGLIVLL